jgi:sugar phosphate isomerase/epimerase
MDVVDLKDCIWGKSVTDLSPDDASRAADQLRWRGLGVYCLSTGIGFSDVGDGEAAWRARHEPTLDRTLGVASVLRPQVVRLLAPKWRDAPAGGAVMAAATRAHPWVGRAYGDLVDRIRTAGFGVTIENEVDRCVLRAPDDVAAFLEWVGPREGLFFTWDVQNLWQMGTFPTLETYRALKPHIGGLHVKGGRADGGRSLAVASALEDASWPVVDIVREVVRDGAVRVICLNPSHGVRPEGYDGWEVARRDAAFLRREIEGIA